uniref:Uncharacterized protein n=1 Tax=Arundo donax TaxID=35708 RepID=A0A0A9DE03_ARUDO
MYSACKTDNKSKCIKMISTSTFLQGPAFDEVCIGGAVCDNTRCIKVSTQY